MAAFESTDFRTFGGNDSVEGLASVSSWLSAEGTTGIGIVDSVVDVGTDNDSVTFTGSGNGVQFGKGFGLLRTTVQGRAGDDTLEIVADSSAINAASTAVNESEVFGGAGDDIVNVSASASGFRSASSIGLDNNSTLFGGEGNDAITISATNSAAPTAFDVQSIGIRNSAVNGGQGSDTIVISAADRVQNSSISTGAENAQIRGGEGDDTIEVSSRAGGGFAPGTSTGHGDSHWLPAAVSQKLDSGY